MPGLPDIALDSLAAGPGGHLYAIGSHGDALCCLLALELHPLRIRWQVDLGEAATGCRVEPVGDSLWVYGVLDGPPILRFQTDTGAPLPPLSPPGAVGVSALTASADATVLAVTEPAFALVRLDARGVPLPLWPPVGFLQRLLFGRGGGQVLSTPVARPTGLLPPALPGTGRDGHLRIAAQGSVARLDREGHLAWVASLPDATAPMAPPRATADGTTFCLFVRGEEVALYRVQPDGTDARPVSAGLYTDLAVGPRDELFLLTPHALQQLDRDGQLVCLAPPDPPG